MITSSSSQTFYPKKILWGSDTVLAITKPQLIKINRSINDYIHLKEINSLLQRDLCVSDSLVSYWKRIAACSDTLSVMEEKKFAKIYEVNGLLRQTLNEQKRKSRKIGLGVGVSGVLLGVLLGACFK